MATKIKYLILILIGFLVMYVVIKLQKVAPTAPGEYHYSSFLRNNYTHLTAVIFLVTGLVVGYYFKLNPLFTGLCLLSIFPITCLYEIIVYRDSHNLIPFELAMHFFMALPAIAGAYLGKLLSEKLKPKQL